MKDGFLHVNLLDTDSGKYVELPLHVIVAHTYLPNPLRKKNVRHKDGNVRNNNRTNLEWVD